MIAIVEFLGGRINYKLLFAMLPLREWLDEKFLSLLFPKLLFLPKSTYEEFLLGINLGLESEYLVGNSKFELKNLTSST